MKRKAVNYMFLGIAVLTLSCASLFAADSDDHGVMVFHGPPAWVWATRPSTRVKPAVIQDSAGLYTIYSNLGPKNDAYDDTVAAIVSGYDSSGGQQWLALPFTPRSNAEVTKIGAAIDYGWPGWTGVTISLAEDKNGLPGKAIHTWNLVDTLPGPFGTCCELAVTKDKKGLMLKKGTQYWVVARTNQFTYSITDFWCRTYNGLTGHRAYNKGAGWKADDGAIWAFGVFGEKLK